MDDQNQTNIEIMADGNDITVRKGYAKDPFTPPILKRQTTIEGPADWFINHKDEATENAVLEVRVDENALVYIDKPFQETYTKITGQLKKSKPLQDLQVNVERRWSPSELADHLKKFRYFFPNSEAFVKLIKDLKNLTGKVDSQFDNKDDKKGNFKRTVEKAVETNLPEGFEIKVPIFTGTDPENLFVEFNIRAIDTTVKIALECSMLYAMEERIAAKLLNDQVKRFESPVTVLYKP